LIEKTNCVAQKPMVSQEKNKIVVKNGKQYFVTGNLYIEITEHFPENGKPLGSLLENVIAYTADKQVSGKQAS